MRAPVTLRNVGVKSPLKNRINVMPVPSGCITLLSSDDAQLLTYRFALRPLRLNLRPMGSQTLLSGTFARLDIGTELLLVRRTSRAALRVGLLHYWGVVWAPAKQTAPLPRRGRRGLTCGPWLPGCPTSRMRIL
jgi:hypothetical protein